jgi:DNA-binding IclR family transcriptional regulator
MSSIAITDLSDASLRVLEVLERGDGLDVTEIASMARMAPSDVEAAVAELRHTRLVEAEDTGGVSVFRVIANSLQGALT